MNVSGNTTSVAPLAAASATYRTALLMVCIRSSTTGGCWTTATLNMSGHSGVKRGIGPPAYTWSRLAGAIILGHRVPISVAPGAPGDAGRAPRVLGGRTMNAFCYYVSRTQDTLAPTIGGCDAGR